MYYLCTPRKETYGVLNSLSVFYNYVGFLLVTLFSSCTLFVHVVKIFRRIWRIIRVFA